MKIHANGILLQFSTQPLTDSIKRILESQEAEIDSAPLSQLCSLYGKIFPQSTSEVLGKELNEDLTALAKLRNLFAHGREVYMKFDEPFVESGTLAGNPLQAAAQRLFAAKIIENLSDISGKNYDEFQGRFFSDEALIYFFRAACEIDAKLKATRTFPAECQLIILPSLPNLPP